MHSMNVALAVVGATVLALGLVSDGLKRGSISEPVLALGVGVLVGPVGLGWLDLAEWGDQHLILEEAARLTLAISLMGVALRIDPSDLRALARPVGWLLTGGMLAMWAISSGVAALALGLGMLPALLLGAVVTPTDPVVASAIVSGRFARSHLRQSLRDTLSLEAGSNDGLAYPFVLLPILLLAHPPEAALMEWLGRGLLAGVLMAAGIGVGLGLALAHVLRWAERHDMIGHHSLITTTVALSLATLGVARLAGADALISVFAAGLAFNVAADRSEEHEEEDVQEAIGKLFTRPVFVLLGLALPWAAWAERPLAFASFALGLLVLRRPLALLVLAPALLSRAAGGTGADEAWAGANRAKLTGSDVAFLGWFGPVGVAALFYALIALRETGDPAAWHAASAAIVASLIAHGVTAAPLTRRHARHGADRSLRSLRHGDVSHPIITPQDASPRHLPLPHRHRVHRVEDLLRVGQPVPAPLLAAILADQHHRICPVSAEPPFPDLLDLTDFPRVMEVQLVQNRLPLMGLPAVSVFTGFDAPRCACRRPLARHPLRRGRGARGEPVEVVTPA